MKIVKAKCKITGKALGIQASDDGKMVLGSFCVSEASYQTMSSQVRLRGAVSNCSKCSKCGNTDFAGCTHHYEQRRCSANTMMDNNCLLCVNLAPDYSIAKGTNVPIQLKAGEVAALELAKLKIGVGWDMGYGGRSIDVDTNVFLLGGSTAYENVYFGNLNDEHNSVHHRGDNLTGRDSDVSGADDDENVDINLAKVPYNYDRVVFTINIYSGAENFRHIRNLYLNIYDIESGDKLVGYEVTGNFDRYKSIIIGQAFRSRDGWEFKALGRGSDCTRASELCEYCLKNRF